MADDPTETEWLRSLVLDACEVLDHYDLPEHAFHYRRKLLGLERAKNAARGKRIANTMTDAVLRSR